MPKKRVRQAIVNLEIEKPYHPLKTPTARPLETEYQGPSGPVVVVAAAVATEEPAAGAEGALWETAAGIALLGVEAGAGGTPSVRVAVAEEPVRSDWEALEGAFWYGMATSVGMTFTGMTLGKEQL